VFGRINSWFQKVRQEHSSIDNKNNNCDSLRAKTSTDEIKLFPYTSSAKEDMKHLQQQ
jgi:hypothetical protein